MPLKHNTETLLVFFLGLAIVATAAVCVFLPPVTVSVWPWVAAFILALAYPIALYPLFRERRVDRPFRLLHFAPALLLVLWFFADLIAGSRTSFGPVQDWLTWNGMIVPVAILIGLIVWFCLSVIRQRTSRIALLLVLLVALAAFGFLNERNRWDRQLATTLWGQSGSLILAGDPEPEADTPEARWRAQLRRMEERSREIRNGQGSSMIAASTSSRSSVFIAAGASSSTSSVPPNLTHAGPVLDSLMLLTVSGYCAAVQRKTMRRSKKA
jgi:hypothetical protein